MSTVTSMPAPVFSHPRAGAPAGVQRLLPADPAPTQSAHLARHGRRPVLALEPLLAQLTAVELTGRGGAAFPTATKIAAVARNVRRRRPVVIVNAAEGDPTSMKDRTLLRQAPHLVLDGAETVADALRADRVLLAVEERSTAAAAAALRERCGRTIEILPVPDRFVASESSALVRLANRGEARPLGRFAPIWQRGVDNAPTLVHNAETLANIALITRFGPAWFATAGTLDAPGTTLVTVTGAVGRPGVVEIAFGTPIGAVLDAVGGRPHGYALVGGLAGGWVELGAIPNLPYLPAALRAAGASRGVGSIVVLPENGCVLEESARILRFLADASAGQCGPCIFGLPAIADDLDLLAAGQVDALGRLERRLPAVNGRGGCAHPDGAVAMTRSALRLLHGPLRAHLDQHLRAGRCGSPAVVPLDRRSAR